MRQEKQIYSELGCASKGSAAFPTNGLFYFLKSLLLYF
ncbi:hypothetical protein HBHAL_4466 [Halobacillus halophilus DSM 2266]|uniref:Uncharacterized protein n=1 Tax=Halobacillus halophilus (strain ATCC 35676 / DSM 2266 / JCM 20832 / KCTC 3685 / LMG 17431 / NBRC 102448 / NCIMB 2269) TaxID=866895 RepID=I0JRN5_HALH3|nr:hypothetical protein HBHAL_4466 [Halobacillus halophilus DSM 2266]